MKDRYQILLNHNSHPVAWKFLYFKSPTLSSFPSPIFSQETKSLKTHHKIEPITQQYHKKKANLIEEQMPLKHFIKL